MKRRKKRRDMLKSENFREEDSQLIIVDEDLPDKLMLQKGVPAVLVRVSIR